MTQRFSCFLPLLLMLGAGCSMTDQPSPEKVFRLLEPDDTGVEFTNELVYTEELNPYTFRNFYNGGGVALNDFNNDGLLDVFFSGNMVENRLFLNLGNMKFRDISSSSGLSNQGVWTTGVAVADINADSLPDIYVCKSGPPGGANRHNELFINNGNLTFTERAKEYKLDFEGLSTHAAFFDYDKDGDLDCYLLNNSIRSVGGYDLRPDQREIPDPEGGNRLLRNDGGIFADVSQQAGIYTSAIGFGLGVTVGDVDMDGWQDIYVSNDFFERDYLYHNNGDGTFTEALEQCMREISLGSMGADMADMNNDGWPEIFVTEMLPESDERLKTTSVFEGWDRYRLNVQNGYYHQFSRNVLQLNNRDGTFSEISRFAGVEATDWSWGALIFDMDNDGWKDIFVANGIFKDLIDQDYVNFIANPDVVREIIKKEKKVIKRLIDSIPSNRIPDFAFRNMGGLKFSNQASQWGLDEPSHSNGSAYGDLDNDGDLDLVLNNVNMPSFVFENLSRQQHPERHFLSIELRGEGGNTFSLGAKVILNVDGRQLYQELSPMRGFMSSVDYRLHFGIGPRASVDSVTVLWPDGGLTRLLDVGANQIIRVSRRDAAGEIQSPRVDPGMAKWFEGVELKGIDYQHRENDFVDFDRDRLLFNMVSNEGPCLCVGDLDGDRLDDFYVGGAKGQEGGLFTQKSSGAFVRAATEAFEPDRESEDTDCVVFDANGDGRMDLYVTSGGNEFSSSSASLLDRLYINQGKGTFRKSKQPLPIATDFESTSTVTPADYDLDGDLDLFVGARLIPFMYGVPADGYILNNDGKGTFTDVTLIVAPQLTNLGMITDAAWADMNKDGLPDLVVVGDWMPIKVFINENGLFSDRSSSLGFDQTHGWYHALETADFNNDGFLDLVVGNHGLNSRFRASKEEPVSLYVNDFDQNGTIEHITTRFYAGMEYPLVLRNDLVFQIPSLRRKYLHFDQYKNQGMTEIFTKDVLDRSLVLRANTLASAVWLNRGTRFERVALPSEAQFSPIYALLASDFDGDRNQDLILGGNLYRAKPETGIYDAGYGLVLRGDGDGNFAALPSEASGILIKGEIRAIRRIEQGGHSVILVARNGDRLKTFAVRKMMNQ